MRSRASKVFREQYTIIWTNKVDRKWQNEFKTEMQRNIHGTVCKSSGAVCDGAGNAPIVWDKWWYCFCRTWKRTKRSEGCTPGISELRAGCDLPVSVRSDRQTAVVHDFSVCDSSGGIYCSDLCINEQAGRNFRPVSFSDPCMWIWLWRIHSSAVYQDSRNCSGGIRFFTALCAGEGEMVLGWGCLWYLPRNYGLYVPGGPVLGKLRSDGRSRTSLLVWFQEI